MSSFLILQERTHPLSAVSVFWASLFVLEFFVVYSEKMGGKLRETF